MIFYIKNSWIAVYYNEVCLFTGVINKRKPDNKTVAYACEGSTMFLSCRQGEIIRIIRANYGRFIITICNRQGTTSGWDLQCMANRSTTIVAERYMDHHYITKATDIVVRYWHWKKTWPDFSQKYVKSES